MKYLLVWLALLLAAPAWALPLSPEQTAALDALAARTLRENGTPGFVVGIAWENQPAFRKAYGMARLDPPLPAELSRRYPVGSVTKQFTATAILLLQEQGKLSLDDPVSKYIPQVTRASEVSVRQLLSHTSGYSDFYPQDYLPASLRSATTASQIVDEWGRRPLDFEPGTRWQYSNTNYIMAGLIVEKASGTSVFEFLQRHVFRPLAMESVISLDRQSLGSQDATGYFRFADGPARDLGREGTGWLFAVGDLAMTVDDLMKWNQSMSSQTILRPESYRMMETEVQTTNGLGTHYALGLDVSLQHGQRCLAHGGEVSGFTCQNLIFPDSGSAVTVLTNQMASPVASQLCAGIAEILWNPPADERARQQALGILTGLQQGRLDTELLSPNAQEFFGQALADYHKTLAPLGPVRSLQLKSSFARGGMLGRSYLATFKDRNFGISLFQLPDGKLEQFLVIPR